MIGNREWAIASSPGSTPAEFSAHPLSRVGRSASSVVRRASVRDVRPGRGTACRHESRGIHHKPRRWRCIAEPSCRPTCNRYPTDRQPREPRRNSVDEFVGWPSHPLTPTPQIGYVRRIHQMKTGRHPAERGKLRSAMASRHKTAIDRADRYNESEGVDSCAYSHHMPRATTHASAWHVAPTADGQGAPARPQPMMATKQHQVIPTDTKHQRSTP
jgi:uncharacterized membrane protein